MTETETTFKSDGFASLDVAKESIKLVKNTKGYNWEIKIIACENNMLGSKDMERLKQLDIMLKNDFGGLFE